MDDVVGREYCLKNPGEIIRIFGIRVFLGVLLGSKKSLLHRVIASHERRGIPMPGFVGKSYRIATMIEYRASRIYKKMGLKFKDNEQVRDFYTDLQKEEEEHARLMMLCLYTVSLRPSVHYLPSIRDKAIRHVTGYLRNIEKSIEELSLDEALDITEKLEKSEINVIFDKLLKQVDGEESLLFQEQLTQVEGHGAAIPKKIKDLKEKLKDRPE